MAASESIVKTMYEQFGLDFSQHEGEETEEYKQRLKEQLESLNPVLKANALSMLNMLVFLDKIPPPPQPRIFVGRVG